ncbi:PH domain-containing protein [Tuberibacillus sp. Marseille-P3662]|uniref:PH domain-containing protein n=1 Tax=Tuberibacillus sp. Marseille-P3662 TaxID=1965358 RepID=UPI0015947B87|nr:PH domain-containing protein [Tuberibacillus sp. Marseille-P3662]
MSESSDLKKLHPLTVVLRLTDSIKQIIVPIILAIILTFKGDISDSSWKDWIPSLVMVGLLFIYVIFGVIEWLRYRYRFEDEHIYVKRGAVIKSERYVRYNRIQSVRTRANVLHRLFGLAALDIETAGSRGRPEVTLPAITKDEADVIKAFVHNKQQTNMASSTDSHDKENLKPPETKTLYQLTLKEQVVVSLTSSAVGLILAGFLAIYSQLSDVIPEDTYTYLWGTVLHTSVVFLIVFIILCLAVLWVVSAIVMFFRMKAFSLTADEKEWVIKRGILEKKEQKIPVRRVQAIRITEGLLRQPLGYATIYAECASGSGEPGKGAGTSVLVYPLIKKTDIPKLVGNIIPAFSYSQEITAIRKNSLWLKLFRAATAPVVISIVLSILFPWGWLAFLSLPLAVLYSYLCYKDSGFGQSKEQLLFTFRTLAKTTVITKKHCIQAMSHSSSPMQKRFDAATAQFSVMASLAGKTFKVRDLPRKTAYHLLDWYRP